MATGAMYTFDPFQQLYQLQMIGAMSPYIKQTAAGISNLGQSPVNTFKGIPDWDRYVRESILNPATYSMNKQLGDLAHSKEFFSSGHQSRRADVMGSTNQSIAKQVGEAMMGQREGMASGMESALNRQMSALQAFNTMMGRPLSVQGQENTVTSRNLLQSIFGG